MFPFASLSPSSNTSLGNAHLFNSLFANTEEKFAQCQDLIFWVWAKRLNSVLFQQRFLEVKSSLFSPNLTRLNAHFAGGTYFTSFLKISDLILP